MSKEKSILIVEDNVAESVRLRQILEDQHFQVTVVHEGQLGLDAARADPPNIVISAVALPDMDGYAVCRELKKDEQLNDVPVILLTSFCEPTDIIKGIECGADNFIPKPYDENLLKSRIEYILLNRELRDARGGTEVGVEVLFRDQKYTITPTRQQMVDLLLSTYEAAVYKNVELGRLQTELTNLNDHLEEKVAERTASLKEEIISRCAAETALEEQKKFLRDVIDVNPNPVFVKDFEGRFTLVNTAMASFYGTTPAAIVGKTVHDLHGKKAEVERILFQDRQVIETARSIHIPEEEFTDQRTGGVSWFQTTKIPIAIADGKVKQLLCTSTNITERKQVEDKLRDSERQYRELIDVLPTAVYVCSRNGAIESFNKSAVQLWGRTPICNDLDDVFCGAHKLYTPDGIFMPHSECPMAQVLRSGKSILNAEILVERPDGTRRSAIVNILARRDDQGNLTGAINCLTDITDRKEAEEKLHEKEQLLQTIFEGSRDGVIIEDGSKITYTNDSFAKLFGYESPDDLIGKDIADLLWADEAARVTEYGKLRLRGENAPTVYEFNGRHADGSSIELEGTVSISEIGGRKYLMTAVRDIAQRKHYQNAALKAEERLRQSQKMEAIGTLTGGVAHDFNNLLTAILGNTQLAQRSLAPDDPVRLRLEEVAAAGKRAAELTNKLLAFSRRQHLVRRVIDLNHTVAEIMQMIERIIGEDIEISVKYAADLPTVFADPAQIEQVIMNLAVNARDAMPDGGMLRIETKCVDLDENYRIEYPYVVPGSYVELQVADSGTGISPETVARIFEPYFTTKAVGKGTGLGLSMAYGIIKQHAGYIHVCSEAGSGAAFKILLPVDAKRVDVEEIVPSATCLQGNETILVAEDEEVLRSLAKDTLESLGYTVLLAQDGEEAIEIFTANAPRIALFLSDVIMPKIGGPEAYRRIIEIAGREVPLIFMTGYSAETIHSRFISPTVTAESLGAMVIQKPYTIEELSCTVREALDRANNRDRPGERDSGTSRAVLPGIEG